VYKCQKFPKKHKKRKELEINDEVRDLRNKTIQNLIAIEITDEQI